MTVRLEVGGKPLESPPARVIDVSVGGALVEIGRGLTVPALHTSCRALLERDGVTVARGARVVRLRLAGRERGVPVDAAVALVFDDGDDDAARTLERWLSTP
jgi:hypothetical protein